jgi:hypothetical protein
MPQDTVRIMKTFRVVVLTVLALATFAACGDDDEPSTADTTAPATEAETLTAELEGGAAEVPAPGDPDGKGTAQVTLDDNTGEVCYDITVEGIAPPAAAHIHEGAAGTSGPVVITFDPTKIGEGETCLTGQKTEDVERILANPAGFYVNVHTPDFQGGAVRGQLSKG